MRGSMGASPIWSHSSTANRVLHRRPLCPKAQTGQGIKLGFNRRPPIVFKGESILGCEGKPDLKVERRSPQASAIPSAQPNLRYAQCRQKAWSVIWAATGGKHCVNKIASRPVVANRGASEYFPPLNKGKGRRRSVTIGFVALYVSGPAAAIFFWLTIGSHTRFCSSSQGVGGGNWVRRKASKARSGSQRRRPIRTRAARVTL